jgi:hypothetical protein
MDASTIFDGLKAKASEQIPLGREKLLMDFIDWIAAREDALSPSDMDLLMEMSLAIYLNKLESEWCTMENDDGPA